MSKASAISNFNQVFFSVHQCRSTRNSVDKKRKKYLENLKDVKDEGEEEEFNNDFINTKFLKSLFTCTNLPSG